MVVSGRIAKAMKPVALAQTRRYNGGNFVSNSRSVAAQGGYHNRYDREANKNYACGQDHPINGYSGLIIFKKSRYRKAEFQGYHLIT